MNKEHRRFLIFFAVGFAVATSLVCKQAFLFNWMLFCGSLLLMTLVYLIVIAIDRWQ